MTPKVKDVLPELSSFGALCWVALLAPNVKPLNGSLVFSVVATVAELLLVLLVVIVVATGGGASPNENPELVLTTPPVDGFSAPTPKVNPFDDVSDERIVAALLASGLTLPKLKPPEPMDVPNDDDVGAFDATAVTGATADVSESGASQDAHFVAVLEFFDKQTLHFTPSLR